MTSVAFVVPAHGRYEVSRVSFAGLAWTVAELRAQDVDAFAVVVADDSNLDIANEYGFLTLDRPNLPLGRKWNDGFEFAAKLRADYVVPFGSDNWIHPELILRHLANMRTHTIGASRVCSVIREDGRKIAHLEINYDGGDGIRVLPAALLKACGYRPAVDTRNRAIDTSIRENLRRKNGRIGFTYTDYGPLQIVGFQSLDVQLNKYAPLVKAFGVKEGTRPFQKLATVYPARLVDMAERMYARRRLEGLAA